MQAANYNLIISRDNPQIKNIVKLANDATTRKKNACAVIYGEHLVVEAIKHNLLKQVFVAIDNVSHYEELLNQIPTKQISLVSQEVIHKINVLESAVNLIGLIEIRPTLLDLTTGFNHDCLILEQIQDPGNLGTILRAACASGVSHVILSANCVDPYNPKVLRASQGIQFGLKIYNGIDLVEFITNYNGQILALTPEAADSLYDVNLLIPTALVLGNEGNGLSPDLLRHIPQKVAIPMQGNTESLNLAMAATIGLFEMSRQRTIKLKN